MLQCWMTQFMLVSGQLGPSGHRVLVSVATALVIRHVVGRVSSVVTWSLVRCVLPDNINRLVAVHLPAAKVTHSAEIARPCGSDVNPWPWP